MYTCVCILLHMLRIFKEASGPAWIYVFLLNAHVYVYSFLIVWVRHAGAITRIELGGCLHDGRASYPSNACSSFHWFD